jgi:hypothetical protein
MKIRWYICIAALLATASQAEETVLVHQAPYEVVLGDASCSGQHERLIRVKLHVPDVELPEDLPPVCKVEIHKGGQMVGSQEIACGDAMMSQNAETGLLPPDTLSFRATLHLCQGLWDAEATMPFAELNGTLGGAKVGTVAVDSVSVNIEQKHKSSPNKDVMRFALDCTEKQLSREESPLEFKAYFRLTEAGEEVCDGDNCNETLEVSKVGFWTQITITARCAEMTAEAAP